MKLFVNLAPVCCKLEQFFFSIFSTANPNTSTTNTNDENIIDDNPAHALPDFEITTNDFLKALQSCKTNKRQGPDNIYPVLLKGTKSEILASLLYLTCPWQKVRSFQIIKWLT